MSIPVLAIRKATRNDLIKIGRAAFNPRRKGGPYVIGQTTALIRFEKLAKAQALHDHYRSCEARARRNRFKQLGWPLVGEREQQRREGKRLVKTFGTNGCHPKN